jgi:NitT/TauT family transport system substrate-binding protein
VTDRCLNDMRCFRGGLTLGVHKIPFRVFSSIGPGVEAQVLPTQNPDQLSLFQQKKIDAVWTVEPWVSRLESEAGGKVLVEEPDTATTVLVSSVKFLNEKREIANKFWQAHRELTD